MDGSTSPQKVVIITGASSGIGRETARMFAQKGWIVVATMRDVSQGKELLALGGVELMQLDVAEPGSAERVFEKTYGAHGRIDVLVNNAGYALAGPIESAAREQIQSQIDTNLVGLMNASARVLPYMRKNGSGVIVNISSMGGKVAFPLYSAYHATKFGVEGFTESLQHEIRQFGIRAKLIEPGVISTDFYSRSMKKLAHPAYDGYSGVLGRMNTRAGILPSKVALEIYRAATDGNGRLRYPVGSDAALLSFLRKILPDGAFTWLVRKIAEG